jgi:hypothetical protein
VKHGVSVKRYLKLLMTLFAQSKRFDHIFVAGDYVFIARELNDLTAVCIPFLSNRDHQSYLRYELGLTALPRPQSKADLVRNVIEQPRGLVSLPASMPSSHTLETFIEGERLSDWLVGHIAASLDRYTADKTTALEMIKAGSDQFLNSLQEVFPRPFTDRIVGPLSRLSETIH